MPFICCVYVFAIVILYGMTGYALLETVLLGAYATMHGFIAVVLDVIHVIVAHVQSRSYTCISLALADRGEGNFCLGTGDRQKQCQDGEFK